MFTKFFFATLVSTLALSAFSSESTQAGRYRVEGSINSGGMSVQTGRYQVSSENTGSFAIQGQQNWNQNGQSQMAGRYSQGQSDFATTRSFNVAPEARMTTQRAPAADVSNRPANNNNK